MPKLAGFGHSLRPRLLLRSAISHPCLQVVLNKLKFKAVWQIPPHFAANATGDSSTQHLNYCPAEGKSSPNFQSILKGSTALYSAGLMLKSVQFCCRRAGYPVSYPYFIPNCSTTLAYLRLYLWFSDHECCIIGGFLILASWLWSVPDGDPGFKTTMTAHVPVVTPWIVFSVLTAVVKAENHRWRQQDSGSTTGRRELGPTNNADICTPEHVWKSREIYRNY